MKVWYLKLHRWIALAFALPLAVVIVTGLILSFEPWLVERAIAPQSLDAAKLTALLQNADSDGARMLAYRSYDGTISLGTSPGKPGVVIDVATGETAQPSAVAMLMTTSRRLHEHLLLDAGWLVVASTVAMMLLIALGLLMGLPRFANSLAGWHKAMSWGLLPLVVLSPLTGLMIAWGVTLNGQTPGGGPGAGGQGQALPTLAEAVQRVGEQHDLSNLVWIRQQGQRVMARLVEDGEYKVYSVTSDAVTELPRNWPRLWHEGNFAGVWSVLLNVIASIAFVGLTVTGLWIWTRRQLRLRAARAKRSALA